MAGINNNYFDLIIIGGGINGAAAARDAVLRGLSVCLIEKGACGEGTSSKSSKLAHGGLRYLEHFEFRMVQETLNERDLLLKLAPKYVKPLPFIYPVYKFSTRPLWKIKLGMWVYHFLAKHLAVPKYQLLSTEKIHEFCPALSRKQLKGGALYYDGQLMDKELVKANVEDALSLGLELHEHSKVIGFIKDKHELKGVKVQQKSEINEFYANQILNTSGPWMNELIHMDDSSAQAVISPTKGAHIVVKGMGLNYALVLESPIDKRIFFMIPWEQNTLIGTTDTDFDGNPDEVTVTQDDVDYLLASANRYLSGIELKESDIVQRFAGLRPLRFSEKGESSRSRDFSITKTKSGLINLFGGKYTSYRLMAEETIDYVISQFSDPERFNDCRTHKRPLT